MKDAAYEALEKRKVNKTAGKSNTPWFTMEIKQLAKKNVNQTSDTSATTANTRETTEI
jgi:hypothetical protein